MTKNSFVTNIADVGKRLDVFLQEKHPNFTRSHIKGMIENGHVYVNGKNKLKAGLSLKNNMTIEVEEVMATPISTQAEDIPLDIIYQDEDLAVINKPQGLVVHPCASTKSGTLVNALLYAIKDLSGINGQMRPGIVHRLDKDTSGLLVVAKNDFAHVSLAEQIKQKTAKRTYLALLDGNLKENEGKIETFLKRDPKDRKKISVQDSGRKAITNFKVLQRFEKNCLVQFDLQTGRTHQIRVHAKYLGHPVVGDKLYGKEVKGLDGQLLHAYRLSFVHPRTGKVMTFEAKLPSYFENYMKKLKKIDQ